MHGWLKLEFESFTHEGVWWQKDNFCGEHIKLGVLYWCDSDVVYKYRRMNGGISWMGKTHYEAKKELAKFYPDLDHECLWSWA